MTFVVGAAAHGSPGVSTTLQMVASLWPAGDAVPVVVEADASGGVLAARYELSLSPGFVTLAESLRKFEAPALLDHAQRLPSGVACVTISPSATAASAQMRSAGPYLGPYLAQTGHPVLLDTGTVVPDGKAVAALTAADMMLWFVRPTREELLVLRHRLAECPQPDNVGIVLVGDTPYNAEQVSDALGIEVLHTLPIDRRGATAVNLGGDDRFLRRSQLARSCSQLVSLIVERVGNQPPSPPSTAPPKPTAQAVASEAPSDAPAPPPPAPVPAESADAAAAAPPPPPPPAPLPPPPPVEGQSVSARRSVPPPLAAHDDDDGRYDDVDSPPPAPSPAEFSDDELQVWQPEDIPEPDPADPDLVVWVNDNQN